MKKFSKIIIAFAAAVTAVSSCDMGEFGDINVSPNSPTTPYTNMFFTYACLRVPSFVCNSSYYDTWTQFWNGYLTESKNNQYGSMMNTLQFSTGGYYTGPIKNLNKIIELNTNDATKSETYVTYFGSNANQIAVATTLRAFYYMSMADIVGPIILSEAFQGDDDIWAPKYDTVSEVYAQLDKQLNDVYGTFDESSSLLAQNEILFGGDITKWKKFNATLRMMMAIKMADVDPANGQARFAKAFADGGMETADDSFTYTFDEKQGGSYSLYNQYMNGGYRNYVPNKVVVDLLKEYQDPRMFLYFSTTVGYKPAAKGDPSSFDTYKGVPFGGDSNDAVIKSAEGCANIAPRYFNQLATYGVITAARCLLVEAEAAELGWIKADAKDLYERGIRASFDFELSQVKTTDPDGGVLAGDMVELAKASIDDYVASVALSDDKDEALKQIVTQRYLAGFMTDGIEQWSDWRRYNIPTLEPNQYQIDEGVPSFPTRLCFYQDDYNVNGDQVTAAIKDLSDGDTRFSRLWWDVK